MLHQIEEHLDLNMLNITYQSAYKKYHSCETALIKFIHDILWNMEKGKITTSIAIDLSAAFDTVDHYIQIQTLEHSFGVHGVALNWFKEYLCDRKFKVCVDGDYSEIKTFNFSVPQGSCSGPQLYCLYSGSIRNVLLDNIDLMAFADDHTLYSTFDPNEKSGESNCVIELSDQLTRIQTWMCKNRLKMNASKTEFILFGSPKTNEKVF